jgi:2-methylcitrate dehydratase PrpD
VTSSSSQGLSADLSRWAAGLSPAAVPRDVVHDARLRILDSVGVTAAASVTRAGQIVRDAALRIGGGNGARILGYGARASAASAALANGTMAHVHDYDDTHSQARAHISAPVISAALAAGEAGRHDGASVLMAVIAGSEIAARLGAMAPGAFHDHGFHATGIVGAIGAAVAAGRLRGLDAAGLQNAIGIAATQASGLAECFADGTWTKRLHPGWAAHSGIVAAELAAGGFTGPIRSLDGARGLFNAHLGAGDHAFASVTDGLGETWQCARSSFKPYPCGHLIHPFIEAIYTLREETGLRADEVARITCYLSPWVMKMVSEPRAQKVRPADEAAAKISIYFCVAAAALLNRVDLNAFTDATLADSRIAALAQKVFCSADPDAPQDQSNARVIVETTDGESRECLVTHGLGSDANPMSAAEVRQKFRACMEFAGLGAKAAAALALADKFETLASVEEFVGLCCRG